jgi:hypothetical protein
MTRERKPMTPKMKARHDAFMATTNYGPKVTDEEAAEMGRKRALRMEVGEEKDPVRQAKRDAYFAKRAEERVRSLPRKQRLQNVIDREARQALRLEGRQAWRKEPRRLPMNLQMGLSPREFWSTAAAFDRNRALERGALARGMRGGFRNLEEQLMANPRFARLSSEITALTGRIESNLPGDDIDELEGRRSALLQEREQVQAQIMGGGTQQGRRDSFAFPETTSPTGPATPTGATLDLAGPGAARSPAAAKATAAAYSVLGLPAGSNSATVNRTLNKRLAKLDDPVRGMTQQERTALSKWARNPNVPIAPAMREALRDGDWETAKTLSDVNPGTFNRHFNRVVTESQGELSEAKKQEYRELFRTYPPPSGWKRRIYDAVIAGDWEAAGRYSKAERPKGKWWKRRGWWE